MSKSIRVRKGMLLVLPVPFLVKGNKLFFETQACNGLERWADNFDSAIVAAPAIPEALAAQDKTMTWRDTATLEKPERFKLVPLPWAYKISDFISCYSSVRSQLAELIEKSEYLQFAIGGLIGDWGAIAALEARQQGRKYAIHTDWVTHDVVLKAAKGASLKRRIKATVEAPLIKLYHQRIIQNCDLGLWHGQDCYSAYSPFCKNSYLIHNIHIKPSDAIGEKELNQKVLQTKIDPTLRICYAGRIDPMKAPLDWVKAISRARDKGANIHATWMGDGILMDEMKALIQKLGLNSCIELTGWEKNRDKLLQRLKESHLLLFTHVTKESARSPIEALVCGTPIVGYRSGYVEELVGDFGGGAFVPMGNWQQLGDLLVNLCQDRQRLSKLIREAGENGKRFNDEAVFRDRSNLIKQHLSLSTNPEMLNSQCQKILI